MYCLPRLACCLLASVCVLPPARLAHAQSAAERKAEPSTQANDSASLEAPLPELKVARCEDFEVTGKGDAEAWSHAQWTSMQGRPASAHDYQTRFKVLYSPTGLYVLFDGADRQLAATKMEDYLDLWTEDVYECFLWPDEKHPVYFEYEISPLGYELPILVPNFDGQFLGWRPWMYAGNRKTRKAVSARGGEVEPKAVVEGWTAEVYIPYELLKPLANVPPQPGAQWRANFYRMDYDGGKQGSWDWARVGDSFHDYRHFGRLIFE